MSRGAGTRLVVALLAATAVGGAAPGPACALTRARANQIALSVLRPQGATGRVVVFGLPAPLGPRQTVSVVAPGVSTFRPLGRRAWLYWEDQGYGAEFSHPSVLLLIGDRGGGVLRRQALSIYPLVDGGPPPFLASVAGYRDPRYQVFSSVPGSTATPRTATPRSPILARAAEVHYSVGPGVHNPVNVAPGTFAHDCLVTVGNGDITVNGRRRRTFQSNGYDAIHQWATDVGLRTETSGGSAEEMTQSVNEIAGPNAHTGCTDVMIYIHGHGTPPPTGRIEFQPGQYTDAAKQEGNGPPGVTTAVSLKVVQPTGRKLESRDVTTEHADVITPADIIRTIELFPNLTFKFKLDTCFAGRFLDDLKAVPRLLVFEYSSSGTEVSYGHIPRGPTLDARGNADWSRMVTNGEDNPNDASEPTNANVHGLYDWAQSPDLQDGVSPLATAVRDAFDRGAKDDFSRQMGYTHPGIVNPDATAYTQAFRWGYHSPFEKPVDIDPRGDFFDADTDFWDALTAGAKGICEGPPPSGSRARPRQTPPTCPLADDGTLLTPVAPTPGHLLSVNLTGYGISSDRYNPDGSIPIRFSILRPDPSGAWTVVTTTNPPFGLPKAPGTHTFDLMTVSPRLEVKAGDALALAFRGGHLAVFGQDGGSSVFSFTQGGLAQNPGTVYRSPANHPGYTLLMNVVETPDPGTKILDRAQSDVALAQIFERDALALDPHRSLGALEHALDSLGRALVELDGAAKDGDTSSPAARKLLLDAFDADARAVVQARAEAPRRSAYRRALKRAGKRKAAAQKLLTAARETASRRGY